MSEKDEEVLDVMRKSPGVFAMIGTFLVMFMTRCVQAVLGSALFCLALFLVVWTYGFFTGDVGFNVNVTTFPK